MILCIWAFSKITANFENLRKHNVILLEPEATPLITNQVFKAMLFEYAVAGPLHKFAADRSFSWRKTGALGLRFDAKS